MSEGMKKTKSRTHVFLLGNKTPEERRKWLARKDVDLRQIYKVVSQLLLTVHAAATSATGRRTGTDGADPQGKRGLAMRGADVVAALAEIAEYSDEEESSEEKRGGEAVEEGATLSTKCVSSNMSVEATSVASDLKVVMGKESARQILQNGQQVANKLAAGEVARTHTVPGAGQVVAEETDLPLLMNASEAARVDPTLNLRLPLSPLPFAYASLINAPRVLLSIPTSSPCKFLSRTSSNASTHARAHPHTHARATCTSGGQDGRDASRGSKRQRGR